MRLVASATPVLTVLLLVVTVAGGAVPALVPLAVERIVSDLRLGFPVLPAAVLVAAFLFSQLLATASEYVAAIAGRRQTLELRERLAGAIAADAGLRHFEGGDAADLIDEARSAIGASHAFFVMFGRAAVPMVSFVVLAAVLARWAWWVPLTVIASVLPGAVRSWRATTARYEALAGARSELRRSAYVRALALTVPGGMEARLYGLRHWMTGRFRDHWSRGMEDVWRAERRRMTASLQVQLLRVPLGALPVVWAVSRRAAGDMSTAELSGFLVAFLGALAVTPFLETYPALFHQQTALLPAFFEVVEGKVMTSRLASRGRLLPPQLAERGICFENVTFAYPGASAPTLNGLTLELPTGSSLALVGDNGSGKTTILKLLCRFYDVDAGRITWEGVDLRELELDELRRRLAVVFQDFARYPMSLKDNVALGGEPVDEATLARAVDSAGLRKVVHAWPNGVDTMLAPTFGGLAPSEGQWQRIALARALAHAYATEASVIALDEPTAALDPRFEYELFKRFRAIAGDRTTLLISHRLSTVRIADHIAVIDRGRAAEVGSHDELLARGGTYAGLYAAQAGRYRPRGDSGA